MGRGLVPAVESDDAGKACFIHNELVVLVGNADDLDAGEDCRQRQVDISAVKKLQRINAGPALEGALSSSVGSAVNTSLPWVASRSLRHTGGAGHGAW